MENATATSSMAANSELKLETLIAPGLNSVPVFYKEQCPLLHNSTSTLNPSFDPFLLLNLSLTSMILCLQMAWPSNQSVPALPPLPNLTLILSPLTSHLGYFHTTWPLVFLNANPWSSPYGKNTTPFVWINHSPIKAVTSVCLLGIHFDRTLTMSSHINYPMTTCTKRLKQLLALANSSYGVNQSDLCKLYLTYIRSLLEYSAPSWYSFLFHSNLIWLQRIQNKALCIILGTFHSSNISDLHLEANIPPLQQWFQFLTASYAEKLYCHSHSDPIYNYSHMSLPTPTIKCISWQHRFNAILLQNNLYPARFFDPAPDLHGYLLPFSITNLTSPLINLRKHPPINFSSSLPPWTPFPSNRIQINCHIDSFDRSFSLFVQCSTSLNHLSSSPFHYFKFRTDASVLNFQGAFLDILVRTISNYTTESGKHRCLNFIKQLFLDIVAFPMGIITTPFLSKQNGISSFISKH